MQVIRDEQSVVMVMTADEAKSIEHALVKTDARLVELAESNGKQWPLKIAKACQDAWMQLVQSRQGV